MNRWSYAAQQTTASNNRFYDERNLAIFRITASNPDRVLSFYYCARPNLVILLICGELLSPPSSTAISRQEITMLSRLAKIAILHSLKYQKPTE